MADSLSLCREICKSMPIVLRQASSLFPLTAAKCGLPSTRNHFYREKNNKIRIVNGIFMSSCCKVIYHLIDFCIINGEFRKWHSPPVSRFCLFFNVMFNQNVGVPGFLQVPFLYHLGIALNSRVRWWDNSPLPFPDYFLIPCSWLSTASSSFIVPCPFQT